MRIARNARKDAVRRRLVSAVLLASAATAIHPAVGQADCRPVACSEVKVSLPYQLSFDQDAGKIVDSAGVGTGFTHVMPPDAGSGYEPSLLRVASGALHVSTTAGLPYRRPNEQVNALGVGFDAPSQRTLIGTRIENPPAGTGNFEQAGLYFGNGQDDYVKLVVISTHLGTRIQLLMEVAGVQAAVANSPVLAGPAPAVTLSLLVDPFTQTVSGSYRLGEGASVSLGAMSPPGEFFSFDAAGIDPTIGTRSFAGVMATHRHGPAPLTYAFTDFSLIPQAGGGPPPTTGDIGFTRSSVRVVNPTSIAYGPDGRVYVTEMMGTIRIFKLTADHQLVADGTVTTLGSRLTLGLTVDPQSTASNVTLWVSHSSPSLNDGRPNSSTITRLSGPGFATREDVITGLPRAKANHAVNSLHFGPDGRLYIAQGGNTGAGAHNTANTEFGDMREQPLSAALLVADVRGAGFDGSCANSADIFGPAPCDVKTYATGLRNTYDFAFHSNGSLYAPDNGLGVTGTFPPSPTPPCTGAGSTTSWTSGGHNPGSQPDLLNRIEPGRYYGHPNPSRGECVFGDGHFQDVAPLPTYSPPLFVLGKSTSSNGIVEYRSDAFGGAMRGDLLIANYSVGDSITRIRLAPDGRSVAGASTLLTGFKNPLPLALGPAGTVLVGEHAGHLLTVLRPTRPDTGPLEPVGEWTAKRAMPQAVLDAGGTALAGKLYAVGGKTSAGHRKAVAVYDPATDTWSTAASLPGEAVENPAVVAVDGRLYAFGGSTSPFGGMQTAAASYDPVEDKWTSLPAMPTARAGAAAQMVGSRIYVIGGMGADGASLASVDVFDTGTRTWSNAGPMSIPRDNPGAAAIGGRIYVFGGRTRQANGTTAPGAGTLSSVEVYDPSTNSWAPRASMPTGRRTMVVGTLRGRVQVLGGEIASNGDAFAANEEYDPATDTWRTLRPLPTPRHGAVAATIGGTVYVAGGGPRGGAAYTAANEAFSFPAGGGGTPGGQTGGGGTPGGQTGGGGTPGGQTGGGGTPGGQTGGGGTPLGGDAGGGSPAGTQGGQHTAGSQPANGTPLDRSSPQLRSLRLVVHQRKVRVRFRLSERARVVVRVRSAASSKVILRRRLGWHPAGRASHLLRSRLVRGHRYILEVIATDVAGNRSRTARARFIAR
jgi:glucose/arabinose dehydrogenase/N-acetylneuraminic acid mutarotase